MLEYLMAEALSYKTTFYKKLGSFWPSRIPRLELGNERIVGSGYKPEPARS